ncbi:MAG: ABC transporter permease [Candidatus Micrarchaeota archaeon]|nr:ABC transporter permease [Candidatus Micrarchaeota archaeon]
MNLLSEIAKDWAQFTRDGRTLLLMLAVPALVVIILNLVFSSTSIELQKAAMGYCDEDGSNFSRLFVSGIANNTLLVDYTGPQCTAVLYNEVKTGKLVAAFIIPPGFEQGIANGQAQAIRIFLDNSKFQVSPSLQSLMSAAVQRTGQEVGRQFIMEVWSQLNDADAKLVQLGEDVRTTRARAVDMKAQLKATADSLNSLDVNSVKSELALANTTLNATYAKLELAQENLTKIESDFAEYDLTLSQTETDLVSINGTLSDMAYSLAQMKSGVNCSDPLSLPLCLTLDSLNASVSSAHSAVELRLGKVRSARAGLYAANLTIQEFKANIIAAKNSSEDAHAKLAAMAQFITQLEENRNTALKTIQEIDSSLDLIINKTYELEGIIGRSRAQVHTITSREPDTVVTPILLSSHQLLGEKPFFDFLLPSMLPLVLMFVALFISSTSLVKEKYYGTFARIRLAQVHPLEFASYKVISYTVVMLPAALILLLLSSLAYGAFPLLNFGLFIFLLEALALTIFVFAALGVLIALYSESEATAFLSSLVVGLPLLFMSGILFPFEFMPAQAAAAGLASPLTLAMLAMQSAITYESPAHAYLSTLAAYGVCITLVSAIALYLSAKR